MGQASCRHGSLQSNLDGSLLYSTPHAGKPRKACLPERKCPSLNIPTQPVTSVNAGKVLVRVIEGHSPKPEHLTESVQSFALSLSQDFNACIFNYAFL